MTGKMADLKRASLLCLVIFSGAVAAQSAQQGARQGALQAALQAAPQAAPQVFQREKNERTPLEGRAFYDEAIEISKLLRDPASANYTLYDSESAVASELKARIYELLREGKTREEIFDFMTARYGEMIRYEPEFNSGTALLWAAPWLAAAAAAYLLWRRARPARRAKAVSETNTQTIKRKGD